MFSFKKFISSKINERQVKIRSEFKTSRKLYCTAKTAFLRDHFEIVLEVHIRILLPIAHRLTLIVHAKS